MLAHLRSEREWWQLTVVKYIITIYHRVETQQYAAYARIPLLVQKSSKVAIHSPAQKKTQKNPAAR